MKPCTRATLFRLVLAIRLFDAGLIGAGRYVLPRKWKRPYMDPQWERVLRVMSRETLRMMRNSMVMARLLNSGGKIGDTLMIRKPGRMGC